MSARLRPHTFISANEFSTSVPHGHLLVEPSPSQITQEKLVGSSVLSHRTTERG